MSKELLKRLTEAEPGEWFTVEGGSCVVRRDDTRLTLEVRDQDQIAGGEALWWMLQEMRSRYLETSVGSEEDGILYEFMFTSVDNLMPATVFVAYIQWKEFTRGASSDTQEETCPEPSPHP